MSPVHPNLVAELEELSAKATPMPWDAVISTGCVRYLGRPVEPLEHGDYVANCRGLDASDANAHLIALMRQALPDLLAIVKAARDCYENDDFITDQGEAANVRDQALGAALAKLDGERP